MVLPWLVRPPFSSRCLRTCSYLLTKHQGYISQFSPVDFLFSRDRTFMYKTSWVEMPRWVWLVGRESNSHRTHFLVLVMYRKQRSLCMWLVVEWGSLQGCGFWLSQPFGSIDQFLQTTAKNIIINFSSQSPMHSIIIHSWDGVLIISSLPRLRRLLG